MILPPWAYVKWENECLLLSRGLQERMWGAGHQQAHRDGNQCYYVSAAGTAFRATLTPSHCLRGPMPRMLLCSAERRGLIRVLTPTGLSGLTFHRSTKHLTIPPSVSHLHILWFQIADVSCPWGIQGLCFCFLFSLLLWNNSEKREARDILLCHRRSWLSFQIHRKAQPRTGYPRNQK